MHRYLINLSGLSCIVCADTGSISLRRKSDLESADAVDDDIEDLPPAPVKIVKAKPKVVKF